MNKKLPPYCEHSIDNLSTPAIIFPMDLNCPHFDQCSGCTKSENLEHPLILEDALRLYPFTFEHGAFFHWRTKAKLAVRKEGIGLYKKGTHAVLPIPHCRVHHPLINEAVHELARWCREAQIMPYDEISHRGQLRYVQFHVERHTQTVQTTLVLNEEIPFLPKNINWVNWNRRQDNVIFSPDWELISGKPYLVERYLGAPISYHPASFAQANPEMFEKLLTDLKNLVTKGVRLLDLYSGVGVIGFILALEGHLVTCVESHSSVLEPFLETKKNLNLAIEMLIAPVEGSLGLLEGYGAVIVDPPRLGLDRRVIEALTSSKTVRELYYISCDFKSYKRDAEFLQGFGWVQTFGKAYLFFPGTDHIELLTRWEKKSG